MILFKRRTKIYYKTIGATVLFSDADWLLILKLFNENPGFLNVLS